MEFGIEICNILILKRGIKDENCDTMLQNDLNMSSLKEGENYKYLGRLEVENLNITKIKSKVNAEYLRHARKVLASKLNS